MGGVGKTLRHVIAGSALLLLAGCVREPLPPYYAYQPAPPPLQPYVEPAFAPAPTVTVRRTVKRRYVRHRRHYHRQVRCPCIPAQPLR